MRSVARSKPSSRSESAAKLEGEAVGAHEDDLALEVARSRVTELAVGIDPPFEHRTRDMDGPRHDAVRVSVGARAQVDDQRPFA